MGGSSGGLAAGLHWERLDQDFSTGGGVGAVAGDGDDDVARRTVFDGLLVGVRELESWPWVRAKWGRGRGRGGVGAGERFCRGQKLDPIFIAVFHGRRHVWVGCKLADSPVRRGKDTAAGGDQSGRR